MKRLTAIALVLVLSVGFYFSLPGKAFPAQCGGKERWSIKVLADADASKVDFTHQKTTVSDLVNMTTMKVNKKTPRQDIEKKTYEVVCKIKKYKTEYEDADIHIVLVDPEHPSVTMIAEIPDPKCGKASHSGHAKTYTDVRKQLKDITASKKKGWGFVEDGLYKVVGVAFVDFPHGQIGKAKNNIELHPVLSITKAQ
jgi:hypothetical protein